MGRFITGLDIGTAAVKTAVAEVGKDNKLTVVSLTRHPSFGVRKGVIAYIEDAQASAMAALEKARGVAKTAMRNVLINVGGTNTALKRSRGMVVVSRADSEIYRDDIDRVIKAAQDVVRAKNRTVVHIITNDFIVDGMPNVGDPMGLTGNKLEVDSFVIDTFSHDIRNLEKAVEKAGPVIKGFFFNPLAVARAVLTKNQRDLGVAVVDIGAGTTDLAVYEEGKLLHAAVLPIGSANVTNDLAIGMKVPIEAAEALKLAFGYAIARDIPLKDKLDMKKIDQKAKNLVSRRFFSEIIEVRMQEIFELVNNEFKAIGKEKNLPAGVVLVGGGAKLPGLVELAKRELKLPVQMGIVGPGTLPCQNSEMAEKAEDPEYANCLGLVLSGHDLMRETRALFDNPFSRIISYFLPG